MIKKILILSLVFNVFSVLANDDWQNGKWIACDGIFPFDNRCNEVATIFETLANSSVFIVIDESTFQSNFRVKVKLDESVQNSRATVSGDCYRSHGYCASDRNWIHSANNENVQFSITCNKRSSCGSTYPYHLGGIVTILD